MRATSTRYRVTVDEQRLLIHRVAYGLVGAIFGGVVVWFLFSRRLRVLPVEVSYGDLAAIALTAATVVLAVLAVGIALITLYGYREFMKRSAAVAAETAKKVAEPVAEAEVRAFLSTNLTPIFEERAKTIATRLLTPAVLRDLIIEQVNEIQIGNSRDRLLDLENAADEGDILDKLDSEAAEDDAVAGEE